MGEDDEGRKMIKRCAKITLGPEHPHSKMTERVAAWNIIEHLLGSRSFFNSSFFFPVFF